MVSAHSWQTFLKHVSYVTALGRPSHWHFSFFVYFCTMTCHLFSNKLHLCEISGSLSEIIMIQILRKQCGIWMGWRNPSNTCHVDFPSISMNMWSLFSEEKAGAEVLVNRTSGPNTFHWCTASEYTRLFCSWKKTYTRQLKNKEKWKWFLRFGIQYGCLVHKTLRLHLAQGGVPMFVLPWLP